MPAEKTEGSTKRSPGERRARRAAATTSANAEQQQPERPRRLRRVAAAPEPEPLPVLEKGQTASKGRATPSRRQIEEEQEDEGNLAERTVGGLREYLQGVRGELQKVTWPTVEETRRLTTVVLVVLVIAAIVLGLISAAFTELFRLGLDQPFILVAFVFLCVIGAFIFARVRRNRPSPY
jgi:preprotein translocase subunit SecE